MARIRSDRNCTVKSFRLAHYVSRSTPRVPFFLRCLDRAFAITGLRVPYAFAASRQPCRRFLGQWQRFLVRVRSRDVLRPLFIRCARVSSDRVIEFARSLSERICRIVNELLIPRYRYNVERSGNGETDALSNLRRCFSAEKRENDADKRIDECIGRFRSRNQRLSHYRWCETR